MLSWSRLGKTVLVLLTLCAASVIGHDPAGSSSVYSASSVSPSLQARGPASLSLDASVAPPNETTESAAAPEDILKIDTSASFWKGAAQLLPNPLYVEQIDRGTTREIRGGGWVAIDVANSRVAPIELFKAAARSDLGRRVVEAKDLRGRAVISPYHMAFPIVRGIRDLKPGPFEVFENPPCLVRAMVTSEDEECEVELRGEVFRYRFEASKMDPRYSGDFAMGRVLFETGRGVWIEIAAFNESFQPLGDPNRDGVPDFYSESVTALDESGGHVLLMSKRHPDDSVEYRSYTAPFLGK